MKIDWKDCLPRFKTIRVKVYDLPDETYVRHIDDSDPEFVGLSYKTGAASIFQWFGWGFTRFVELD